ncbi:MAG TPA: signal peptidase II [Gaiellaceae bacterium]|nr:signal peptidase II [Gaiellaceae bacterium]
MSEAEAPARRPTLDVRVGSSTHGLRPISAAERSLGAGLPQWLSLAAVAFAAVAADQATKQIVASQLPFGHAVHIVGPFSLHHVQNTGIAFGLFPNSTALIALLTAVAVAWMIWFFARSGSRHPVLPTALGLLIGGSVSNLADRIRIGHVTDFLDVRYWPAFNLADSFICVGVLILLLTLVRADREPRRARGPRS